MHRYLSAALGLVAMAAVATPAAAADLRPAPAYKAPPAAVVVPFSWTGCYVGVHGGGAWGEKKWYDGDFQFTDHNVHGWLVGGQLGCNVQRDRWVFGIEGQASYADIQGDSESDGTAHSKADIIGTVAARIGHVFGPQGRTLLYLKGGLAFAQDRHWFSDDGDTFATTSKYMRWGWMLGAGFEHALDHNWSIKGEYNYMNLGTRDVTFCDPGDSSDCFDRPVGIKQDIHVFKMGVNYRFGGGRAPVVARY